MVLNKCDRLLLELHLDPLSAYERLRRIVEDVNALCGTLHAEHVMVGAFLATYTAGSADESLCPVGY